MPDPGNPAALRTLHRLFPALALRAAQSLPHPMRYD